MALIVTFVMILTIIPKVSLSVFAEDYDAKGQMQDSLSTIINVGETIKDTVNDKGMSINYYIDDNFEDPSITPKKIVTLNGAEETSKGHQVLSADAVGINKPGYQLNSWTIRKVVASGNEYETTVYLTPNWSLTPLTAANVVAKPGDKHVTLSWTGQDNATGYKIYKSTTSNSYTTEEATVAGNVYNYDVTNLNNGIKYYFKVKAFNSYGAESYSNEVNAIPVTAPGKPTDIVAKAGNGEVTVNFNPPADTGGGAIKKYIVTSNQGEAPTEGYGSPITVKGLKNGTAYTFKVKAVNENGDESQDSEASNEVIPWPPTVTGVEDGKTYNYNLTIVYAGSATAATLEKDGGTAVSFSSGTIVGVDGKYKLIVKDKNGVNSLAINFIIDKTAPTGTIIYSASNGKVTATLKPSETVTVTNNNGKLDYEFTDNGEFTFEFVDAAGNKGTATAKVDNIVKPAPTPTPTPTPIQIPTPTPVNEDSTKETGVKLFVNNIEVKDACMVTKNNGEKTMIAVDSEKLNSALESVGKNAKVTILNNNESDVTISELNGDVIKNMEAKGSVLELKTKNISYRLAAEQINIENQLKQLGKDAEFKDITVQVEIGKATDETVKIVNSEAAKDGFTIIMAPIEFTVKCTNGDKTVEVEKFDSYVEKDIDITDGVDLSKITTAIVIEPDGEVRPVPTKIVTIDGKNYARIHSLTNSTYSLIYKNVDFNDTSNSWAKEAINDMGARLIISGNGKGDYEPNKSITRAEFAKIIVSALGLKPDATKSDFNDIKTSDWYSSYVNTAREYKLIAGYNNGNFGANNKITREQAMTMIGRAMKITGINTTIDKAEVEKLLSSFTDSKDIADYAKDTVALCVKFGVVSGRVDNKIASKSNITRAEVAAIIQRLLKNADLI